MGTTARPARRHDRPTRRLPQAPAATSGPTSQVPVAFLGRTSNERLQDPIASLRRQVRKSHAWLPPGCQIVACYWDVESGGLTWKTGARQRHLADRRRRRHPPRRRLCRPADRREIPHPRLRVRGLREHRALRPGHATTPCNWNGNCRTRGFRCSPPTSRSTSKGSTPPPSWSAGSSKASPNGSGSNSKTNVWSGLKEHSLDGWNLGKVPIGYLGGKPPAPQPGQGRRRAHQNPPDP